MLEKSNVGGLDPNNMRESLRYMPLEQVMQYKTNPAKKVIGDVPMDLLAGLELAKRAQEENEKKALAAPDANMPTTTDQYAQQLQGIAGLAPQGGIPQQGGQPQQGQPQQAPQGQPQQAQQPQGQPQQPQQPQAQQPQGIQQLAQQQPAQPTQQQPKKLAAGGIVAFQNNPDQPVDEDMPGTKEYPERKKSIFTEVGRAITPSDEDIFRKKEEERRKIAAAEVEPSIFERLTPAEREQARKNAELLRKGPQNSPKLTQEEMRERYGRVSEPKSADADTEKEKIDIQKVPDPMQKLYDQLLTPRSTGSTPALYNPVDFKKFKDELMARAKMSPEGTEAMNAYQGLASLAKSTESPYLNETDRAARETKKRAELDAELAPLRTKQQQALTEQEQGIQDRYADKASNARLRFGLGLLGSKDPSFGGGLKEAAMPALDYYEKMSDLETAAKDKLRDAQLNLEAARIADARGNRKDAEEFVRRAESDKVQATQYQFEKQKLITESKVGVYNIDRTQRNTENNVAQGLEKFGMQLQHQDQMAQLRQALAGATDDTRRMQILMQMEKIRSKALDGSKPSMPALIQMEKYLQEQYASPMSPGSQRLLQKYPEMQAMLKNKVLTWDNPKIQDLIAKAKRADAQELQSRSKTSGGSADNTMSAAERAMGLDI